jgi:hypothetical protein
MWKEAYLTKLNVGSLSVYLPRALEEYLEEPEPVSLFLGGDLKPWFRNMKQGRQRQVTTLGAVSIHSAYVLIDQKSCVVTPNEPNSCALSDTESVPVAAFVCVSVLYCLVNRGLCVVGVMCSVWLAGFIQKRNSYG